MAAPAPAPHFWPRTYVVDAFTGLRPDLPPAMIDILVNHAIAELLAWEPAELPSEAFIP